MEIISGCAFFKGSIVSNAVAAFDLDGTLVKAKQGKSASSGNWEWVSPRIPELWEKLSKKWTMVIFSNQKKYPGNWHPESKVMKLLSEMKLAGNPFVYLATGGKPYRKPENGMWKLFLEHSKIIPEEKSFFCGDAVGDDADREEYRWSDADIGFSINCDLNFYTPNLMWGFP
jgi:DNA 3'-phosphatase